MIITRIINRIVSRISEAENVAIRNLSENAIETEPSLTDRFLGAIDYVFEANGFEVDGFNIKTRTLKDRGRNAAEHEFGSDFISVLNIGIPSYSLSKGFLAQAKLAGKEEIKVIAKKPYPEIQVSFPTNKSRDNSRLITQCEQMLNISSDSFVFVYSSLGIYVVPATTIVSIKEIGIQGVYSKTLQHFYKDFLMSFVGDRDLNAFDDATLRKLRDRTFSNSALAIEISSNNNINTNSRFKNIEL